MPSATVIPARPRSRDGDAGLRGNQTRVALEDTQAMTTKIAAVPRATAVPEFNAQAFLDATGVARGVVQYARDGTVFQQGYASDDVMYIQSGGIKLSVLSKTGKEAVVAMLGPGDFFGEGCLAGQTIRMGNATAITPSSVLLLSKARRVRHLHPQPAMPNGSLRT